MKNSNGQSPYQKDAKVSELDVLITSEEMKYEVGPEELPEGTKAVLLYGDMSKQEPFVMRLEVPSNYFLPPHIHSAQENVTVLDGEIYFGLGEKYDRKTAKKMTVGSLIVIPIGHQHYFYTQDKPATIQLHSVGPWDITYINPSDDPRK